MEVHAYEESFFNIERCNWADEVEDSMELELVSNSTSNSDMSTTCAFDKTEPSVPLNLLRLKSSPTSRASRTRGGSGSSRNRSAEKKQQQQGQGQQQLQKKKSRGGSRSDNNKGSSSKGCSDRRKKTDDRAADFTESQKAVRQYLQECGGARVRASSAKDSGKRDNLAGSLQSSTSMERQHSGRADTSDNWNADKAQDGATPTPRPKRFGSGGRGVSGSGSSTSRSGGSTARSVASRADTEEWTRPLRVNPDPGPGREEPKRRTRADCDSWRRSGGRRKNGVEAA